MNKAKARLLVIRNVRRPTGGNIKVRDYFRHAGSHPCIDAQVWFPPWSRHDANDIWDAVPANRIAPSLDLSGCRFVCVNGKDWSLLPASCAPAEVIHFVQHAGYLDDPQLRGYLERPARRICTSQALHDVIAPAANGPVRVVPIGIDDAFFGTPGATEAGRVTVAGAKQPKLAAELCDRLKEHGVATTLLGGVWRPHAELVALICATDVLVTLPHPIEGFFLPALEGMAAGCVVVCNDAVGNRSHCIPDETCLQPPRDDLQAHLGAVLRALTDEPLRRRLREGGRRMALKHTMAAERAAFHGFIDAAIEER
jgi:hypothetical protein